MSISLSLKGLTSLNKSKGQQGQQDVKEIKHLKNPSMDDIYKKKKSGKVVYKDEYNYIKKIIRGYKTGYNWKLLKPNSRLWFRGRILLCHGRDLNSIPSKRNYYCLLTSKTHLQNQSKRYAII